MCRHLLIFPGSCPPSIFSASELNFRVRNGNGWTLTAINTDCIAPPFLSGEDDYTTSVSVCQHFFKKFLKNFFKQSFVRIKKLRRVVVRTAVNLDYGVSFIAICRRSRQKGVKIKLAACGQHTVIFAVAVA